MADESVHPTVSSARVRRVPKYGVFLVLGGALGVVAALILTFAFDNAGNQSVIGVTYSSGQVFGFLALFCIVLGIAVGAIVALIFDRAMAKRTRKVTVERETIITQD
ncbi:hypothetical protein [Microbacterium gorillae]|uniref:hypothetical protein n=1 Tax=Microbacterium gorillae TaxID=1231063 RepID=UPI00058D7AF0|nr:hypothetical protein [Microbacterium gorillae]